MTTEPEEFFVFSHPSLADHWAKLFEEIDDDNIVGECGMELTLDDITLARMRLDGPVDDDPQDANDAS